MHEGTSFEDHATGCLYITLANDVFNTMFFFAHYVGNVTWLYFQKKAFYAFAIMTLCSSRVISDKFLENTYVQKPTLRFILSLCDELAFFGGSIAQLLRVFEEGLVMDSNDLLFYLCTICKSTVLRMSWWCSVCSSADAESHPEIDIQDDFHTNSITYLRDYPCGCCTDCMPLSCQCYQRKSTIW